MDFTESSGNYAIARSSREERRIKVEGRDYLRSTAAVTIRQERNRSARGGREEKQCA